MKTAFSLNYEVQILPSVRTNVGFIRQDELSKLLLLVSVKQLELKDIKSHLKTDIYV